MSQPLAKTPPAYNSSVLCPCDPIPLLVVLFSIAGTGHLNRDTALSRAVQSIKTEKEKAIVDETYNLARARSLKTEKNVFLHKRDKTGGHPTDLGDFDTLVFLEDAGVLLNIECKYSWFAHFESQFVRMESECGIQ